MAIIDYYGRLSTNHAETTASAHDSTNYIDTELADANLGEGNDIYVKCKVRTAVVGVTAATITVEIQDSVTGSTWTTLLSSEAYDATSAIAAGTYLMKTALPKEHKRYLKAVYTIGTDDLSGGAWDTWLDIA